MSKETETTYGGGAPGKKGPDNNRDPELRQVLRDAQEKYFARKPQRQPAEVRTGLEGQPVETDHSIGTLPDGGRNPLSGDEEQTTSGPGG